MRRLFPLVALLLAACATTPPPPAPPAPAPARPNPPASTNLIGQSEPQLAARFGPAPFRLREGSGLKLQWSNAACVLDAYLYPPERGAGPATVLHVDARRPGSGETLAVEACVISLASPRT